MAPGAGSSIVSLSQDFKQFQAFTLSALTSLHKQLDLLAIECDSLEMGSRRKMLLLHGAAEAKNEDTRQLVVSIAIKHLGLPDIKVGDINRAHRMGRAAAADRPRPLVVKFREQDLRDRVWFAKTNLKGSGITMSEFLTKRRHKLFKEARQRVGVAKCWSHQGRVVVLGDSGKRHIINSYADIEKFPRRPLLGRLNRNNLEARPRREHQYRRAQLLAGNARQ